MTRFSRVLNEILIENGWTQSALASLSQINQEKLSRLINSQTRATRDDLTALFSAVGDQQERFRLARAHISDEIPEEMIRQLEISLESKVLRDALRMDIQLLPGRAKTALDFLLREYAENPSIGDVFIDFALALGWKEQSPSTNYPAPESE